MAIVPASCGSDAPGEPDATAGGEQQEQGEAEATRAINGAWQASGPSRPRPASSVPARGVGEAVARMPRAAAAATFLGIVDEQAALGRCADRLQHVAEDRRVRLGQAELARDEDVPEAVEEGVGRVGPHQAEGLGRPVGQRPQGHAGARRAARAGRRCGRSGPPPSRASAPDRPRSAPARAGWRADQLGDRLGEVPPGIERVVPFRRADLGEEASIAASSPANSCR